MDYIVLIIINGKKVRLLLYYCISIHMYDIKLNVGTVWKRYIDQLLVSKSLVPISDPDSLIPANDTNI